MKTWLFVFYLLSSFSSFATEGSISLIKEIMDENSAQVRTSLRSSYSRSWEPVSKEQYLRLQEYEWTSTSVYADYILNYLTQISRAHGSRKGSYPKQILFQNAAGYAHWFSRKLKTFYARGGVEDHVQEFMALLEDFIDYLVSHQKSMTPEIRSVLAEALVPYMDELDYSKSTGVLSGTSQLDFLFLYAKLGIFDAYHRAWKMIKDFNEAWFRPRDFVYNNINHIMELAFTFNFGTKRQSREQEKLNLMRVQDIERFVTSDNYNMGDGFRIKFLNYRYDLNKKLPQGAISESLFEL